MFRESLLETSVTAVAQRSWATMMSFSLEMAGIATLIILPLFIQQAVPVFSAPPVPRTTSLTRDQIEKAIRLMTGDPNNEMSDGRLHAPGFIPKGIVLAKGKERPAMAGPADICTDCVYDPTLANNSTQTRNIISSLVANINSAQTTVKQDIAAKPPRISVVHPGALIYRVEPVYPRTAMIARIQGTVRLAAIIATDGTIQSLHVLSGPPILMNAAREAVSHWRYRPTVLNGQAVEIDTQIEVNFVLNQ